MGPDYSIIIPAYNEAKRLAPTLDKVLSFARAQRWKFEVIVVNDGSRDNTADIVATYSRSNSQVRLIENPGNRGKGYAVKNGMLNARGRILLMSDADLSSPIEEASKLFDAIERGADVAIGSRWLDPSTQTVRQPWYRQLFGRVFNMLIRVILGLGQKDTQCGFKAFSRSSAQLLFRMQRIERWGFDPELLFLSHRFHLTVREVAVEWAHDPASKIRPFRDAFNILSDVIQVRRNAWARRYSAPLTSAATA